MIDEHIDEGTEETPVSAVPTPIISDEQSNVMDDLRRKRTDLEPIGKTLTLEIPGYDGKLGVKYHYVGTDETERISKRVMKETKKFGHRGMTLLSSVDLLIEACDQLVIPNPEWKDGDDPDSKWKPLQPAPMKFDRTLADAFELSSENPREIVLAIFGSEHAAVEQNMRLSQWLTDTTREVDDDFFGL